MRRALGLAQGTQGGAGTGPGTESPCKSLSADGELECATVLKVARALGPRPPATAAP